MMTVATTPKDAKKWFGTTPPDLSVIARQIRQRRPLGFRDYIYTYLRTFYRDTERHGLEQPGIPGRRHAARAVGTAGSARAGPTTVAMHEVEGKDGAPKSWERVTTVYDAQGFSTVKAEPVANYHGHATFEAKLLAANPNRNSTTTTSPT